jgi:Family of unknown function (DUF6166)
MKVYKGARSIGGLSVLVGDHTTQSRYVLPMRLELANHSPTGFNWGYLGSGPSQLALALCADATGDDVTALAVYMDFKARVVAKLPFRTWLLTDDQVREHIRSICLEWEGRPA